MKTKGLSPQFRSPESRARVRGTEVAAIWGTGLRLRTPVSLEGRALPALPPGSGRLDSDWASRAAASSLPGLIEDLSWNQKRHLSFLYSFSPRCNSSANISSYSVLPGILICSFPFRLLFIPNLSFHRRERRKENAQETRRGKQDGPRKRTCVKFLLCYRHCLVFHISDQFCFIFVFVSVFHISDWGFFLFCFVFTISLYLGSWGNKGNVAEILDNQELNVNAGTRVYTFDNIPDSDSIEGGSCWVYK